MMAPTANIPMAIASLVEADSFIAQLQKARREPLEHDRNNLHRSRCPPVFLTRPHPKTLQANPALEFDFELEIGKIALEICKIQRAPFADRVPGDLRRECRGQHHLAGELDVQCRADVQSIADEGLHAKSVKSPVILQLTA